MLRKLIASAFLRPTGFAGTPGYLSPEVLKKEPYGKPVDIWACGEFHKTKQFLCVRRHNNWVVIKRTLVYINSNKRWAENNIIIVIRQWTMTLSQRRLFAAFVALTTTDVILNRPTLSPALLPREARARTCSRRLIASEYLCVKPCINLAASGDTGWFASYVF